MFTATTLLRRYTPPTCTLELYAQQSPLSRWANRPVVRDLRFRLHLDDPRLPDEQRTTIQGDREQLEALHAVIETYVQGRLTEGEWDLGTVTTAILKGLPSSINLEETQLAEDIRTESIAAPSQSTPPSSPPAIALSSCIPTSLPETDAEALTDGQDLRVTVPPTALHSGPSSAKGLGSSANSTAAHRDSLQIEPDGGLYHRLHLGPLATAAVGDTVQLSTLQLFDLATALDTYSEELMALPETLGKAWFKPSIAWARTAAIAIVAIGMATSIVRLVEQPQIAMQTEAPTGSEGASSYDQRRESVAVAPLPTPSFRGLPGGLAPEAVPGAPPMGIPTPPPGSLAELPPYTAAPPAPPPPGASGFSTVPIPAAPPPDIAMAPPPPPPLPAPSEMGTITIPAEPSGTPLPEIPAGLRNEAAPPAAARSGVSADEAPAVASQESRIAASAGTTPSTAFDVIPQVAEVRSYFQGQWQVPEGLSQTLEYSLVLNANGSIQRIFPLGQAAGNYIDRTGMPLIGEPFVSPTDGKQPRIRLVLKPDGKVQTFLESMN